MTWSTSELMVRLAPLNRFKPSSKIFYWPFQGGTSFVDLLWFVLSCVCYVFMRVCLYVLCGHLLGKGWPLGSRLWCLTVSLSLSHWYPGSGVVLDCIDSWSLHPYLLCCTLFAYREDNFWYNFLQIDCSRLTTTQKYTNKTRGCVGWFAWTWFTLVI